MDQTPDPAAGRASGREITALERLQLARERLAFEREKWEAERGATPPRFKFTAAHAAVFAAIATLAGTVVGALLQAQASRQLEEQKFQSGLIVKAFESTSTREESLKYLRFLRATGLAPQLGASIDTMRAEDLPQVRTLDPSAVLVDDLSAPIRISVHSFTPAVVAYRLWLRSAKDTAYSIALTGSTGDSTGDEFEIPAATLRAADQEIAYWIALAGTPGGSYRVAVTITQGDRRLRVLERSGELNSAGIATEEGVVPLVSGRRRNP
jgi:hypothetical protein